MAVTCRRRGSVLLMAIGLLTILAILASTFLIISNLDAQEAETLAVKAISEAVAERILHTAMVRIAEDRWSDGNSPYAGLSGGPTQWKYYVDSPGGGDGERIDEWLADSDPNRLSSPVFWSAVYDRSEANDPTDTDGDGTHDAFLRRCFPTADAATREGKLRAAVRVVDLGAKVCLNTAGDGDANDGPDTRSPALINLVRLLGDTVAAQSLYDDKIHKSRGGGDGQAPTLKDYDTDCGRRLLSPAVPYNPFAIGDEVFLLWREPLYLESVANVGRLHTQIGPYLKELTQETGGNQTLGDFYKRLLTTLSCTSAAVRRPNPANEFRELQYLDVWGDEQGVYRRMKLLLDQLGLGVDDPRRKQMASAFVSNLKTYLVAESSGKFQPTGETFTTYGYRGDLVITEVVGKHYGPSKQNKQDWAWGCAVELLNPTDRGIPLLTEGNPTYKLLVAGREVSLAVDDNRATLASRQKVVFYRLVLGADADGNMTARDFFGPILNGLAIDDPNFDFAGDGNAPELLLVRNHADGQIPVDQVRGPRPGFPPDFPYVREPGDPAVVNAQQTPTFTSIQRHDRYELSDASGGGTRSVSRYLFPYYVSTNDPSAARLGRLNTADSVVAPRGNYAVTFQTVERTGTTPLLHSVGELCNIHLVSPILGISEKEITFGHRMVKDEFATVFPDSYTRGKLPFAPDANSGAGAGITYGGYSDPNYPDVPAGCLFAEFFTNVVRHRRPSERGRLYGLVNVNTAPREVLRALPWPTSVQVQTSPGVVQSLPVNRELLVEAILAYRQSPGGCGIANLRTQSSTLHVFLTPGEVAIPLAAYMRREVLGSVSPGTSGYYEALHAPYRAIADCIATRSDVFGVYIKVQYGALGRYRWHYLAIVDRSNVLIKGDAPALLLFCEVQPTR